MSILGKELNIPASNSVLENATGLNEDAIGTNYDYCLENYGDITLAEEIFMDQIVLMESFHELDCIENAYYADKVAMESASLGEEEMEEREALFEADQEAAKSGVLSKMAAMVRKIAEKVKGVYNSLIQLISAKFSSVDKFINKYSDKISKGSCKMELYEYKDVGPDNPKLQMLNTNRISQTLNNALGGQLSSALSTSPESQKNSVEKLNNFRKQLGKFDHDEICNTLRGKKETREIKGSDVLRVIKDKAVIGDLKKQVNSFNKAANDVANGVARTAQNHKGNTESVQLINAYVSAFNAQAQVAIRTAKCVIEVAQERLKVYLTAARKIAAESVGGTKVSDTKTDNDLKDAKDQLKKEKEQGNEFSKDDGHDELKEKREKTASSIKDRHAKAAEEVRKSMDNIYNEKETKGKHDDDFKQMSDDLDDLLKDL